MPQILQIPRAYAVDGNGKPYAGARAFFYITGTSTPKTTYSDYGLTTPNSNPVVADSNGLFPSIFLATDARYRMTLKTSVAAGDLTIYTQDDIGSQLDLSQFTFTQQGTGAVSRTALSKMQDVVHIKDFGGLPDGSDTTAAFNLAVAATVGSVTTIIKFGRGVYRFTTKPNDITTPVKIVGDGMNTTYLIRDYNGGSATVGLFNFRAGGSTDPTSISVENCSLLSESGRSGGCLVSIVQPSTGDGTDWSRFSAVRFSTNGTSTHDYGLYIDGSARTSPLGLRSTWVQDCIFFGGLLGSAYVKSVVNFNWSNSPTYSAGGASGKIVLTGTSGVNSYNVNIQGPAIYGMDLDYCQHVTINTPEMNGAVTNTANALNVTAIYNQTSGTTGTSWVNSNWFGPASIQGGILMERGGGGNQLTARFNSSNRRSGLYTAGTSGETFVGGNLKFNSGNRFDFDKTGVAWYIGDPGGNGRLALGCTTGAVDADASVGGASDVLRFDTNGNVWPGRTSAQSMTNGFFYVPAASGAPSGTPTSVGGYVPMYYDTGANQFYVYNGAWKKVTLA